MHGVGAMTMTHRQTYTPTWQSWTSMRRRCKDTKRQNYKFYGGRGIKACERWEKFENFLADMGHRPDGTTLDRIDNQKDHGPGNCRWATPKEQSNNRRPKTGHKTHCYKGHLLPPVGTKSRRCPTCHAEEESRRRAERKSAAAMGFAR